MRTGSMLVALTVLLSACATKRGPGAGINTDLSTGIISIPVDYLGGVTGHEGKETGILLVANDSTSFVSRGESGKWYTRPTSSITDVQVSNELDRSVRNFLLLGIGGLFFKDKHEYLTVTMFDEEKRAVLTAYFAIKVGTGNQVLGALEAKTGKEFEQKQPPKQIG